MNAFLTKKAKELFEDEHAETIVKYLSTMGIGLAMTILVVSKIFSATDDSIDANDTEATTGYTNVKSYFWLGIGLVGILLIVVAGRQIMDNL